MHETDFSQQKNLILNIEKGKKLHQCKMSDVLSSKDSYSAFSLNNSECLNVQMRRSLFCGRAR